MAAAEDQFDSSATAGPAGSGLEEDSVFSRPALQGKEEESDGRSLPPTASEKEQDIIIPGEDSALYIPSNFLNAAFGDMKKAIENWKDTLEWRRENRIEKVLQSPQPNFKLIKALYPWYFHRYDKKGNVCVHYQLGQLRLPKLFAQGIGPDDIFEHNVFYQEYLWTVVMPKDTDKVTLIFDLKDLSWSDVNSEVLGFIKNALSLQSRHWPARTEKSFIINAPIWFSYVFALIRPLLNQRQREKVAILDEYSSLEGLKEYIDEENLPKEYGGSGVIAIGDCATECQLWEYVRSITEEAGESFRELRADDDNEAEGEREETEGIEGGKGRVLKNNSSEVGREERNNEITAAEASSLTSTIASWWGYS